MGYYHDGDGLYLQVRSTTSKSWVLRYQKNGKAHEMGLGSYKYISLAEARQKRNDIKKSLIDGIDPISEKQRVLNEKIANDAKKMTFRICARNYIESHKAGWKNPKHISQWENTLESYAYPIIGDLTVDQIDTNLVMKIIEPIWTKKTETANRVRGRMELILSWATVRGLRKGENPARWRGHLDHLLPKRSLVQKVTHLKALPYPLLAGFMNKLKNRTDVSSLALQFLILTATRTNETLGARWSEFNFEENTWTIPAERMKAKKEHRIPLTDTMLQILRNTPRSDFIPYVFRNPNKKNQISSNALLQLLSDMKIDATVHGFRSSFRDWVSEETSHGRDVAEAALAHTLRDKVEAAYRRGDFFQKRRILMEDWGKYCYDNTSEKQPIHINKPASA
jgi:integrase